jgi:hypothetical protein
VVPERLFQGIRDFLQKLEVIILVAVGTVMPVMEFLVRTTVVGVPP